MISKQEFISECDKIIAPEEMEEYNKKKRKRTILLAILLPIEVVIWLIIMANTNIGYVSGIILVLAMIITLIIVIVSTKFHWKDFKTKYGKQVIEIVLKDQQFRYESRGGLPSYLLSASGFCGNFERCSGEDFFQLNIPKDDGTPSNVEFTISDMYATRTETYRVTSVDSKGRSTTRTETRTVVVYSGLLGYVKFPFKFKCNLSLNAAYPVGDKIKLEDIKFNKLFKVFTDNQIEALVMLTPTMMEKLKALNNRLSGIKIMLRQNGEFFIGAGKDMFTLNKKKPTGAAFEYFYDDLADFLAIINEIKNNNKLFDM